MGLFSFGRFGKSVGGMPPSDLKSIYLSNDPQTLARLRHAIWGDWYHEFEVKSFPNVHGIFRFNSHNDKTCKTTLRDCTCEDLTEDGKIIRPCVHMYRLAIETGQFDEWVRNPQVEKSVREMRTPLFNNFYNYVISRGYYEEPHEWYASKKTFDELKSLGLIRGDQKKYYLTPLFMDNAAAWVYYTMTDPRRK